MVNPLPHPLHASLLILYFECFGKTKPIMVGQQKLCNHSIHNGGLKRLYSLEGLQRSKVSDVRTYITTYNYYFIFNRGKKYVEIKSPPQLIKLLFQFDFLPSFLVSISFNIMFSLHHVYCTKLMVCLDFFK